MPVITIRGNGTTEVPEGTRLVKAIAEHGVEIGHRCGGQSRCTTCRVKVMEGEPDTYTLAEYEKLKQVGELGEFRLSCQMVVKQDMTIEPLMLQEEMGWDDTGPDPADNVEPDAERFSLEELEEVEQRS